MCENAAAHSQSVGFYLLWAKDPDCENMIYSNVKTRRHDDDVFKCMTER